MGAPEAILKNATDVCGGEVTVMAPAGAVWGMEIDELFEADVAPVAGAAAEIEDGDVAAEVLGQLRDEPAQTPAALGAEPAHG